VDHWTAYSQSLPRKGHFRRPAHADVIDPRGRRDVANPPVIRLDLQGRPGGRGRMMAKHFYPVFIATALATATPAPARWLDPATAGYCVSGTCSKFGGRRAVNIKNCRPENCRDFAATNVKAPAVSPKTAAATGKPLCPLTFWSWMWFWPHAWCAPTSEAHHHRTGQRALF
jgi:hypothetical protein